MAHTFKYSGRKSEIVMLLVQALHGFKYRVGHSTLLDMVLRWKDSKNYSIFCSVKEDDVWVVPYTRLLLKIAYDLNRVTNPVMINGQELKVGEWLADLMMELMGDRAGMLATLDEGEDRK